MAAQSPPKRDGSPQIPPGSRRGALRFFLPVGLGLAIALTGTSAVERSTPRPARLDGVVLRGGQHVSIHQKVDGLRDGFVAGDELWRAKDYPSLLIGVHDDRVVAIISAQSADIAVPGIRLGRRLDQLGSNLPPMTPTQLGGRPGVMVNKGGTQFYVLSAPTNITCRFRATADQVVIVSGPGVEMARSYFLREPPCLAQDDKSGLA